VIRARGLHKAYGDQVVVAGIDVEVPRGQRVALLGLNGAGKTTLFRCLLGLTPFRGSLTVDGLEAGPRAREVRRRVGYVPQRPPLFDLSLSEFVALVSGIRGIEPAGPLERLAAFGLSPDEAGGRPLRELSGGMLQKAFLALALGEEVSVLLLDEPTASLDPEARRDVLRAVDDAGPDTTVVLATHRLEDVRALAERVLVLGGGRFVFDGPVSELEAVAADERLVWIDIPAADRAGAARSLAGHGGVRDAHVNGKGIELSVAAGATLAVLSALETSGFPVTDFHSRPPELEAIMARLVGPSAEPAGPTGAGGTAAACREPTDARSGGGR